MTVSYRIGILLLAAAITPALAQSERGATPTMQGTTLTLLGTGGGPGGNPDRKGPARKARGSQRFPPRQARK